MKTLIILLLFGFFANICFSQPGANRSIYDDKGDYYFDKKDFKKAIVYYNMAYKKSSSDFYSILKKAEAFANLKMYSQAEECYKIAFEKNSRLENVYRLKYAIVLLKNNKNKEFEYWLKEYNKYVESDIKSENYITSKESRVKLYKDSTITIVTNLKEINSKESEINPAVYKNKFIFSSTRKNLNGVIANNYYNFFSANYSDNRDIDKINFYNKTINTNSNEGAIAFDTETKTLLFTRSSSNNSKFKTFKADIPKDVNSPILPSEFLIENFGGSIGHPTLNSMGTVLYFVSDASGGLGGTDIYKCRLINNKWSTPENLGNTINSKGDELYPFVFNDSILYFASNRQGGQGGFDLFSVNLMYAEKNVENLGNKVNSKFDEYSLFMTPEGISGYFTSNRPGGLGKEDIYKVDFIKFKIKYSAFIHRRKANIEDDKINLMISNGNEHNIVANNGDFEISFHPMENYKLIIQRENIYANDILANKSLTKEQRAKKFLTPPPLQQAEIFLLPGMKYDFSFGQNKLDPKYIEKAREQAKTYQPPNENTINLTTLAKELLFLEDEIYTVRIVKDNSPNLTYKGKGESALTLNEQSIPLNGESFLVVLPHKSEVNFNIQNDLEVLSKNFDTKKYAVVVDESSMFKKDDASKWLLSMVVNTDKIEEVNSSNYITASDISIVPGTEYILSLIKIDPLTEEEIEIVVPLTHGVKYNLTTAQTPDAKFKHAFAEFLAGQKGTEAGDEEVIDISVLSKELEVKQGDDLSFTLLPAKQIGKKPSTGTMTKTRLTLDEEEYLVDLNEKYIINVPTDIGNILNIQTDIDYIKENYEFSELNIDVDTTDLIFEIAVDTSGYASQKSSGWLVSMNINTESTEEVAKKNQITAEEVSIIPGKEYILTVSKYDSETGEDVEIIVPLTREVKYDFTSNPLSDEAYKKSLEKFLLEQKDIQDLDAELIDISLLSKELQIKKDDKVSFSLLPVKKLKNQTSDDLETTSSLYLDNKVVEFTQIQKYTINVPLQEERKVNLQTNIMYLEENFKPGTYKLDVDTNSFFSEITVDTTGYGDRVIKENTIKDPVFDVVVVNFDLNDYSLRPESKKTIQSKVVDELKKDKRLYVTITGYTDGLGDAKYNLKLSKKRAETVKKFLSNSGVGESRIRTFSFGEAQTLKKGLKWENLSEEELQKHRKVEIVIYLPK